MADEAHDKAIAAAVKVRGQARLLDTRAEEVDRIVGAYLASLVEQGDSLVRVSEVVDWLRDDDEPPRGEDVEIVAQYLEDRFDPRRRFVCQECGGSGRCVVERGHDAGTLYPCPTCASKASL